MILEKMAEFFDARLDGYEEHQLNCIDCAKEFYPYTASLLPMMIGCEVLDLGCGTGLELEEYFKQNSKAKVTGIDLAPGMLQALRQKYSTDQLTLIQGSYFEVAFEEQKYDAAVSVESLHHFTQEKKAMLYARLHQALKQEGYFILTDYLIDSDETECANFSMLAKWKAENGISDEEFYHYDTPLTCEHEIEALLQGGFSKVERLCQWGNTTVLKAYY